MLFLIDGRVDEKEAMTDELESLSDVSVAPVCSIQIDVNNLFPYIACLLEDLQSGPKMQEGKEGK